MKDRIKQIRVEAGLTQAAFAARIGVKMNHVSFIETGRRVPSPATVREICRQFSVREEWLRYGTGDVHYDLTPALDAAARVRRLLVDAPNSTAASVIYALATMEPSGPEWEVIASLLDRINERRK